MAYMADSGRMTRDWYFVILDLPETADSGATRYQAGEASCLQEARRYLPGLPSLMGGVKTFSVIRLRMGSMFDDPIGYDLPGFTGEIVEQLP